MLMSLSTGTRNLFEGLGQFGAPHMPKPHPAQQLITISYSLGSREITIPLFNFDVIKLYNHTIIIVDIIPITV